MSIIQPIFKLQRVDSLLVNADYAYIPFQWEKAEHRAEDLVTLFNGCFASEYSTELVGGANEPLYQPSNTKHIPHTVFFSFDYFSSALHEIAHWCIAGEQRRRIVDYGYWYAPDGRSASEQALFEKVEIKPQAIELAFSIAAKKRFRVSTDNLENSIPSDGHFAKAVALQFEVYCKRGFPPRAAQFIKRIKRFLSQWANSISRVYQQQRTKRRKEYKSCLGNFAWG